MDLIIYGIYWCQKFEADKKNAQFIKITKAGFYESMVHSVEMTQKLLIINYDIQDIYNILFFIFLLKLVVRIHNFIKKE